MTYGPETHIPPNIKSLPNSKCARAKIEPKSSCTKIKKMARISRARLQITVRRETPRRLPRMNSTKEPGTTTVGPNNIRRPKSVPSGRGFELDTGDQPITESYLTQTSPIAISSKTKA